jgi:hypothetical protein
VGVQVLFRYALAVLSYMEEKLMKQTDYMSIFNTFRAEVGLTLVVYAIMKKILHLYKQLE